MIQTQCGTTNMTGLQVTPLPWPKTDREEEEEEEETGAFRISNRATLNNSSPQVGPRGPAQLLQTKTKTFPGGNGMITQWGALANMGP
jgi:hypothetical protein